MIHAGLTEMTLLLFCRQEKEHPKQSIEVAMDVHASDRNERHPEADAGPLPFAVVSDPPTAPR